MAQISAFVNDNSCHSPPPTTASLDRGFETCKTSTLSAPGIGGWEAPLVERHSAMIWAAVASCCWKWVARMNSADNRVSTACKRQWAMSLGQTWRSSSELTNQVMSSILSTEGIRRGGKKTPAAMMAATLGDTHGVLQKQRQESLVKIHTKRTLDSAGCTSGGETCYAVV